MLIEEQMINKLSEKFNNIFYLKVCNFFNLIIYFNVSSQRINNFIAKKYKTQKSNSSTIRTYVIISYSKELFFMSSKNITKNAVCFQVLSFKRHFSIQ